MVSREVIARQLWTWDNEAEPIPFSSPYHWDNLAVSARLPWYNRAAVVLAAEESEEEIQYWKDLAREAITKLGKFHAGYEFTGARPPSPREVREIRAKLKEANHGSE